MGEITGPQPVLCKANRNYYQRERESVEECFDNKRSGWDFESFAEEVEGNEKRGEETHGVEVFRRGQSCYSSSEKACYESSGEGSNEVMDAESLGDNGTDDSGHEQERELRAGCVRNDIFAQSQKEERSKDNEQQDSEAADGEGLNRAGLGDDEEHQDRADLSGDCIERHLGLFSVNEAGLGQGVEDKPGRRSQ